LGASIFRETLVKGCGGILKPFIGVGRRRVHLYYKVGRREKFGRAFKQFIRVGYISGLRG